MRPSGPEPSHVEVDELDAMFESWQLKGRDAALEDVLIVPLRETITHVLAAFEGTGIAPEHLAAQIESQVRGWIKLSLEAAPGRVPERGRVL